MPNLSQSKRERMLAFLQKIKDEHRDDDDMLIALGEIESELTSKKYGLVWEQHEEAVDVMMRDNIPVFTEVPEREITAAPGQGYNFILEGDNLHALHLLTKTHRGKIDVIYIDPPYNTKNMLDFCADICIDISALVYFLLTNKNNIVPVYINFTNMAEDTVVIVEATIVESAMELLPLLFSDYKCYFKEDEEADSDPETAHAFKP